ncbi:CBS domain-containing protein [Candidatus Altiarchaeota archaeon]
MEDKKIIISEIMSEHPVTIGLDANVQEASSKMGKYNISSILIAEGNNLHGILTENDILEKVILPRKDATKLNITEIMSKDVSTVTPDTRISKAAKMIREGNYAILPVVAEGKLVGLISRTDTTGALGCLGFYKKVSDSMSTEVQTIEKDNTIQEASKIMSQYHISSIIATEGGKPVGILTEKDLMSKVAALSGDPLTLKVEQVMSSPLITIDPHTSIAEANMIQRDHKFRELPIVEDGRLVGILSETDILRVVEQIDWEYERLNDLAADAMNHSAHAVTQMIGKEVEISISEIVYVPLDGVVDLFGTDSEPVAGISLELTKDILGNALVMFPEETAHELVDMLMSQDPGTTREMDDMGKSALKELSNIMVGNYMAVLDEQLSLAAEYEVPSFTFEKIGSILGKMASRNEDSSKHVLASRTDIRIEGKELKGYFLFMLDPESIELITKRINEDEKILLI